MLSASELFRRTSLKMCGPVPWKTSIPEKSAGVYVIGLIDPAAFAEKLSESEFARWNPGEEVIYIGKATNLRRRLSQFYRHEYGRSSPHRGGQGILLLTALTQVYWATTSDCAETERAMIDAFYSEVRALPFANRMRGARKRPTLS